MTLREVLQTEIWSKETTRRIVRKFVIPLGIVLGVAAVVFGSYSAIDNFWLTPHERSIAREVLLQIDVLQRNLELSAGDFEKQKNLVQVKIDAAQKAAWTVRDRRIAAGLSAYLELIEIDRDRAARLNETAVKYPAVAQKIAASDKKYRYMNGQISLMFGKFLHQLLD